MEASRKADKFARGFIISFWTVWQGLLLLLLLGAMVQEQTDFGGYILLAFLSAFYSALAWYMLSVMARAHLDETGVSVRVLLKTRFYPWDTIKQAGILWRRGRGLWYNEIVLVKANGHPRRYKDKTFLLRNIGRVIQIPYGEETKAYIIQHYGPLDFDLSDGRSERSVVAE